MRFRKLAVAAAVVAVHASANAWFFIFPVPVGALADKLSGDGEHCVSQDAKVGDVVKFGPDRVAIVEKISGPWYKCPTALLPIRAKLDIRLAEHVRTAEHIVCGPQGQSTGGKFFDVGLGEVQVVRHTNRNECNDAKTPVQMVVKSTQPPLPVRPAPPPTVAAPAPAPAAPAALAPAPVAPAALAAPAPVPAAPAPAPVATNESPAALKLRELNGLLKDGLITQADYEAKKAEILKSF